MTDEQRNGQNIPPRPVAVLPTPDVNAPGEPPQQGDPRLVLPDGGILQLSGGVIVGRDPQHQPGYGVSVLARLHDIERSVSKTHAVIGVSDGRVWVIDLNSTNGTVMIAADGAETLCPPEVVMPLAAGAGIRFGEYRVAVAFG